MIASSSTSASIEPEEWPAIREPTPSLTYDIGHVFGQPQAAELDVDLERKVMAALRRAIAPHEEVYAPDWQHPANAFRPVASSTEELRVPVLPNGDYYAFVASDFRLGSFGHPWEQTICVFGAPLLETLAADPARLLDRLVRRDGRPVSSADSASEL